MKLERSLPGLVHWHTFSDRAGFGENSLYESLSKQNPTPEHSHTGLREVT